jgi:hypothetical protein
VSRTEAVLRLYRAAREFTRRVTGVETLEEAALAYAREMGWAPTPPVPLVVNVRADADAVIAEQRRRIGELKTALRDILSGSDDGVMCTSEPHPDAIARARAVLE